MESIGEDNVALGGDPTNLQLSLGSTDHHVPLGPFWHILWNNDKAAGIHVFHKYLHNETSSFGHIQLIIEAVWFLFTTVLTQITGEALQIWFGEQLIYTFWSNFRCSVFI